MSFLRLRQDHYAVARTSMALPMLTSQVLTTLLKRLQQDGELSATLAFDEWLSSAKPLRRSDD